MELALTIRAAIDYEREIRTQINSGNNLDSNQLYI